MNAKGNKRGPNQRPQWVTIATNSDEGDNNKEPDNSDEELVTTAKRDFKCQAW
jgi:hypothetical protein